MVLGEFVDDRVQVHTHTLEDVNTLPIMTGPYGSNGGNTDVATVSSILTNRAYARNITTGNNGATTEVKAVGMNFIIRY